MDRSFGQWVGLVETSELRRSFSDVNSVLTILV